MSISINGCEFNGFSVSHWRRQLWGTGVRAPSTSNCLIFSGHFRTAQTQTLDSIYVVAYPEKNILA